MMRQVGARLRFERLEARLSQKALGALIGVTNIQIGCYETGATPLPLARAVLLAGALDIDVRRLLPSADDLPTGHRRRVEEYPELIALYRQLNERSRSRVRQLAEQLIDQGGVQGAS